MADLFQTCFSPLLISDPLPDCREPDRNSYPSPTQLLRRIIIKHKKLTAGSDEVVVSSTKQDEDLSSSLCNGFLYLEDKLDGQWTKARSNHTFREATYTRAALLSADGQQAVGEQGAG